MNYELLTTENAPVKMWTKGVPVEADARQQLINTAKMPFIFKQDRKSTRLNSSHSAKSRMPSSA